MHRTFFINVVIIIKENTNIRNRLTNKRVQIMVFLEKLKADIKIIQLVYEELGMGLFDI